MKLDQMFAGSSHFISPQLNLALKELETSLRHPYYAKIPHMIYDYVMEQKFWKYQLFPPQSPGYHEFMTFYPDFRMHILEFMYPKYVLAEIERNSDPVTAYSLCLYAINQNAQAREIYPPLLNQQNNLKSLLTNYGLLSFSNNVLLYATVFLVRQQS